MQNKNRQYKSINGLRTIAAICIILMHVAFNVKYDVIGIIGLNVLNFFNDFVYLFMIISGFGMCCGYYEKISKGEISIASFYQKRYEKIWPYFAVLVVFDLVMSFSVESLIEAIADLTLTFSLLPNPDISIIGVGWTLGVIFLFYMLFPFFCFLLKNKKRAWFAFAVAIFYNIAAQEYFMDSAHVVGGFRNRSNFAFCAMFFVAGGLVYLYRESIEQLVNKYKYIALVILWIITIGYLIRPDDINKNVLNMWLLVIFLLCLIYAIGTEGKILNNKVTTFISSISMEIYLSHMVIFRVVERIKLTTVAGGNIWSYIITVILVIGGSIIFALCAKWFLKKVTAFIKEKR